MLDNFFSFKKPSNSTVQTVQTGIKVGDPVYITADYHVDNEISAAEVPRFGWTVSQIHSNNSVTIEYCNKRISMKVSLIIASRYLKVER